MCAASANGTRYCLAPTKEPPAPPGTHHPGAFLWSQGPFACRVLGLYTYRNFVFVATYNVTALHADSGSVIWNNANLPILMDGCTIVPAGDDLLVMDASLQALNIETGHSKWQSGRDDGNPTLIGSKGDRFVAIGGAESALVGRLVSTGADEWHALTNITSILGTSNDGSRVLCVQWDRNGYMNNGSVISFDVLSREIMWRHTLILYYGYPVTTVASADQRLLFVAYYDENLKGARKTPTTELGGVEATPSFTSFASVVDSLSGDMLWRNTQVANLWTGSVTAMTFLNPPRPRPCLFAALGYGSNNCTVTIVEGATGDIVWEHVWESSSGVEVLGIAADVVVVYTANASAHHDGPVMKGINATTGAELWMKPIVRSAQFQGNFSPLRNGALFAIGLGWSFGLYDTTTGERIGHWKAQGDCYNTILEVQGKVVTSCADQYVYAIEL